jgi:bifunctional aspartokinase / homoserine dehydrogenase 1
MKFGGSSVGRPERLRQVIELIAREPRPLAIVVSAMGDTTDWLIESADLASRGESAKAEHLVDQVADLAITNGLLALESLHVSERPPITPLVRELLAPLRQLLYGVSLLRERSPQTLDLVMSFGERVSASVLAELLKARKIPAVFVDSRTWVVTDDRFGDALVDWAATSKRIAEIEPTWGDRVAVNTGFLGQTADGRTTTLGRNGSDYTASLLARGLAAEQAIIWTDVSGVMTADPGIVSDAYPLPKMSYLEALELASFGARMFHPRTMIPLIESSIPMRIRNTMHPDDHGTVIDTTGAGALEGPTCVTSLENLALISLRWRRLSQKGQLAARVLRALDQRDISATMATQSGHGQAVAVVVRSSEVRLARAAIEHELALEIERREVEPIDIRAPVTLLTLVAETMSQSQEAPGRLFHALGAVGINVRAIAQGASSRSISCVLDASDTQSAVRTVHAGFNFAHAEMNLFLLGKGTVGGQLLEQIESEAEKLKRDHGVALRLVGLAAAKHLLFDERGLAPKDAVSRLASAGNEPIVGALERLRRMPMPVLIDCTAADGMDALYSEAFKRGIHVVSANKKPLTIAWTDREALMSAARRGHRAYHYETTVGASLPVIDTLKSLVRTGDRVLRIEGSLSGTLGYLANQVMSGSPLSKAVETARALGYTEPRPQDDLSGLDVARKALILARELGLPLSLDDVSVEPLVPQEIIAEPSIEGFLASLRAYDATFTKKVEAMQREGRVLRYLARIDPTKPSAAIAVGPTFIEAEHAATRLRGSEAFIAFTTARYSEYPLIVQGAGAGGAVTAAGVLADVLKIAQSIRGRG